MRRWQTERPSGHYVRAAFSHRQCGSSVTFSAAFHCRRRNRLAVNALQKAVFYTPKGCLLACKRRPFGVQNVAFRVVNRLYNKRNTFLPERSGIMNCAYRASFPYTRSNASPSRFSTLNGHTRPSFSRNPRVNTVKPFSAGYVYSSLLPVLRSIVTKV